MNQILEYDNNRKGSENGGSDKVVKIFAIVLVIFAVILICVVLKQRKETGDEGKTSEQYSRAEITPEIDQEKNKVILSIKSDAKIEKLIYYWESDKENVINGSSNEMEEEIDMPTGNNVLHIKVVDVNGNETVTSVNAQSDEGIDIKNPEINLEVTQDAKLKVIATDETELKFITYKWNDEEEVQIDTEDDNKKIETEIEILKGENDITIIAVDASNNTTTERKTFTGRTKPSISVVLSSDGSKVDININDEYGVESVKLNFNGQDYDVNLEEENALTASFGLDLENGNNRIIVTATNIYGISNTFDGECPYGNTSEEQSEENNDDENNDDEHNDDEHNDDENPEENDSTEE